jgi:hypothetical protein
MKARRDDVDQVGSGEYAKHHEYRNREREHRTDRPRQQVRTFLIAFAEQAAIDRDKGCGQDAFAEQILQNIGDAKAGLEGVGRGGVAKVMRKDAFADQTGDPAEQDPRRYQTREIRAVANGIR